MSPAEVKKLEKKIDQLEKKLDIVIQYITVDHGEETDWLDDPQLVKTLNEIAAESEKDIKAGRVQRAEEVFEELGV